MESIVPQGMILRHPTWDDLQAVADLIIATEVMERGESDFELDDLSIDWKRSAMDLSRDAWVMETDAGRLVGYEELFNANEHSQLMGDGYVHPDFRDRGVGTALLRTAYRRAQEHLPLAADSQRVYIRNGLSGNDAGGRRLHENEGYKAVRFFWRMQIDMSSPPETPVWGEGFQVRTMAPGVEERAIFDVLEAAFKDHWGDNHWDYETWLLRRTQGESFDPSLWFLATTGGRIAGCAICRNRQDAGWVSQLAVLQEYRHLGLGRALLLESFGNFYRRGVTRVGLGVDAENTTGATRLYLRAGMHVAHEYVAYEKELRPAVHPGAG